MEANNIKKEDSTWCNSLKKMYTIKEFLALPEYKGIFTDYTIRTLIREGKLPHVRLCNRKLLLCKETIDSWLSEQEARSVVKPVEVNTFGLRKL
jgi:hypothetical protein